MKKLQLDEKDPVVRVSVAVPTSWVKRLDEWRRYQPDMPNLSETIRRMVDAGFESVNKKGGKRI
jgi:hypothetical protein